MNVAIGLTLLVVAYLLIRAGFHKGKPSSPVAEVESVFTT